jgi:polyhydroxyalkanoate synthase
VNEEENAESIGDVVFNSLGLKDVGTGLDLAELLTDIARVVTPQSLFRENLNFTNEALKIMFGASEVTPEKGDRRFNDPAWSENPVFKRIGQTYMALSKGIENLIPDDIDWPEEERARFAVNILVSGMAPTNNLATNPTALKRLIETGGSSIVDGTKNLVHDLQHNGGMPAQVDTSKLKVGKDLAVTPGAVVFRNEVLELIQYAPQTEKVKTVPVLLIPPQIGKYYFTDLAPDRSYIEYVVSRGLQFFTISWCNPTIEQRDWGLETYLKAILEAMNAINDITGQRKINFVGFCAGGIQTSILLSYLKAIGDTRANSATLSVTLLDFDTPAAIGGFRVPALLNVVAQGNKKKGLNKGADLGKFFAWLRPNDLVWNYWVNNYLMGECPPSFDILAWNSDVTNMPEQFHNELMEIFAENGLISGDIELFGEPINIKNVDCDKFVLGAATDHLTPWGGCYQTTQIMQGKSTFALSSSGHIAALVNPPGNPKSHYWIGEATAETPEAWKETAELQQGTWWEAWVKWCAKRSGRNIESPTSLGSEKYPPLCAAPGEYVMVRHD